MAQRVVADGLFAGAGDDLHLLGTKCDVCAHITFPVQSGCPQCGTDQVTTIPLSPTGTLWTWTRQRFQPKNPPYAGRESAKEFQPYGVGFIELPEGRVEARLVGNVDTELTIGMPMRLTVLPFATDDDGTEILTYAFEPAGGK